MLHRSRTVPVTVHRTTRPGVFHWGIDSKHALLHPCSVTFWKASPLSWSLGARCYVKIASTWFINFPRFGRSACESRGSRLAATPAIKCVARVGSPSGIIRGSDCQGGLRELRPRQIIGSLHHLNPTGDQIPGRHTNVTWTPVQRGKEDID